MTETNTPENGETASQTQPQDVPIPEVVQSLKEDKFDVEFPYIPLAAMKPGKYNPRVISDEAMSGLTESLNDYGLIQPLVWNKRTGNLVGGHQRYKVLLSNGVKEAKTCVVDLDENQEVVLNLTLNNPNIQGSFESKMLSTMMKVAKGELTMEKWEKLQLKAMEKQLPLYDGVKEQPNADQPKKRMTAEQAKEEKLEKADIKMVQLFYTGMQHKQVMSWLATAAVKCETDNYSDTVYKLLEAFNTALNEEAAAEVAKTEPSETPAVVESLSNQKEA